MRDEEAPGPLTPASASLLGSPRNRQIPWGETAPGRLGRRRCEELPVLDTQSLSWPGVRKLLYLSREAVERLLVVAAMLQALAQALVAFSAETTIVPPRAGLRVPEIGIIGTMPWY